MALALLGWNNSFAEHFRVFAEAGLEPARVAIEHRGAYELYAAKDAVAAEVSGKFRHEARTASDFPAVGDWVAMRRRPGEARAIIHGVLPRRTRLSRTTAGDTIEEQLLAANIDEVFIVTSLNAELNPRRIERYLTLARASGAQPVVLLNKSDLCEDVAPAVRAMQAVACDAPVHAISGVTGKGMKQLTKYLREARTAVLLGSSGVGKSTIINRLCDDEGQPVLPIREWDGKGRHTTTRRELICLPSGALLIDTPGMRELQLWNSAEGLAETFADIAALAAECRFIGCRHEHEPECAVVKAVAAGQLLPGRLESYRKLTREVRFFSKRDEARAQAEARRRLKGAQRPPHEPEDDGY